MYIFNTWTDNIIAYGSIVLNFIGLILFLFFTFEVLWFICINIHDIYKYLLYRKYYSYYNNSKKLKTFWQFKGLCRWTRLYHLYIKIEDNEKRKNMFPILLSGPPVFIGFFEYIKMRSSINKEITKEIIELKKTIDRYKVLEYINSE